jgi:hypothetical protein
MALRLADDHSAGVDNMIDAALYIVRLTRGYRAAVTCND